MMMVWLMMKESNLNNCCKYPRNIRQEESYEQSNVNLMSQTSQLPFRKSQTSMKEGKSYLNERKMTKAPRRADRDTEYPGNEVLVCDFLKFNLPIK